MSGRSSGGCLSTPPRFKARAWRTETELGAFRPRTRTQNSRAGQGQRQPTAPLPLCPPATCYRPRGGTDGPCAPLSSRSTAQRCRGPMSSARPARMEGRTAPAGASKAPQQTWPSRSTPPLPWASRTAWSQPTFSEQPLERPRSRPTCGRCSRGFGLRRQRPKLRRPSQSLVRTARPSLLPPRLASTDQLKAPRLTRTRAPVSTGELAALTRRFYSSRHHLGIAWHRLPMGPSRLSLRASRRHHSAFPPRAFRFVARPRHSRDRATALAAHRLPRRIPRSPT